MNKNCHLCKFYIYDPVGVPEDKSYCSCFHKGKNFRAYGCKDYEEFIDEGVQ
jgi:hypothetical protein